MKAHGIWQTKVRHYHANGQKGGSDAVSRPRPRLRITVRPMEYGDPDPACGEGDAQRKLTR